MNKMNPYFKGILMGIIITLTLITMMGFSGGGLGTRFNPMYVKIVN